MEARRTQIARLLNEHVDGARADRCAETIARGYEDGSRLSFHVITRVGRLGAGCRLRGYVAWRFHVVAVDRGYVARSPGSV